MQLDNANKEKAREIFKANPKVKQLFLNKKGEFFTRENLVKLSVKKAKDYITVTRNEVQAANPETETKSEFADLELEDLKGVAEELEIEYDEEIEKDDLIALIELKYEEKNQ